jgi:two-component system, LytTR family, response regulator
MSDKEFIVLTIKRNRKRKFYTEQILYCKADNSYTTIKLLDNKSFIISKQLKEIEGMLSKATFYRVSRNLLININHCIEIKTGRTPEILLTNHETVFPEKKIAKEIESKVFTPQVEPTIITK